jgi:hypothetical protein
MATTIYVARDWHSEPANPQETSVWLDDTGYYWYLYRYFEGASLDKHRELVDLYDNSEIDGYQLDRLEDEMKAALEDATGKPDEWMVLTGWKDVAARENEIRQLVKKDQVVRIIEQILWLISYARTNDLRLIVSGD